MKQETVRRIISFSLLVILIVVLSVTTDNFLTSDNLINLFRECSVVGILAVGVTFVIISSGNNLSSGAMLGTVAMVIARLYHSTALSVTGILLCALLVAICLGALNGFCVGVLQIPDYIATLSVQMICQGLTYVLAIRTAGGQITNEIINNATITSFGGKFLGTPIYRVTVAFFALAIIGQIFLRHTKIGTHIYAMGSNRKSAEYSGISFVRIKMLVFILSAICSFIAALYLTGRNATTDVASGTTLSFQAISGAVIGGASFAGGRGDMIGTVIGVLFLQILKNGLLKYGLPPNWQLLLSGLVIVGMIVFDAAYNEYMEKRTTKAAAIAREKKGAKS